MSGRPTLPIEEAIKRLPKNIAISASHSFNAEEVAALSELLVGLLAGRDVRKMAQSKALTSVARKVPTMKAAIVRQKERRAAKAAARKEPIA